MVHTGTKFFGFACYVLFILNGISGFSQTQPSKVTGVVSDQFGSLPGAKIEIAGTSISTSTDVNGFFELLLPTGSYNIQASFVMYSSQSEDVSLQPGDSVHIEYLLKSGFTIDEQVAVGSRSKPRTLLETTVPIDIIPQQSINMTNQVELGQIMHFLEPSFHSTHQTISDGTDHIDPATLRGLGPDQVLVLINGKRRHTSSLLNVNGTIGRGTVGTDLNAIPYSAIDRIEILRDGAASQYGSDAIAGVINIILKEQTGVNKVDGYVGTNKEGDGQLAFYNANIGFDVGDGGFANFTLEFRDREATNRSGAYTGNVYQTNDNSSDQELIQNRNFFNHTGFDEERVMEVGHSSARNISFFFNAELPVSNTIDVYANGGRNYRNGSAAGFYRFPKDSSRIVSSLYPDGFSPKIETDIRDGSITIGLKGIKNNWNIDISNTNGINELDFNITNSNNASLGTTSPTEFYAGGFLYSQNATNFDVSRTMNWLQGVNVAFGVELRLENYQILAGEDASWGNGMDSVLVGGRYVNSESGAQVFPGFRPENALSEFRTNSSWYFDIESKFTDRILIGTSGRYESYSDFGDQATWKLSGRYRLLEGTSLMMGYATGFRAPSLHQVHFNSISTQFPSGQPREVATLDNKTAVSAFDIDPLKPELSRHISAGVVSRINSKLSLSVNYYRISIDDRIVLSGSFSEGLASILQPLGVDVAQFFTNAIDTKTSGVEFSLYYKNSFGKGQLSSDLRANFNQTLLDGGIQASGALVGNETTLFNREEIGRIEEGQPSYKIILRNSIKRNKFTVALNGTLFGRVAYRHPDDGNASNWLLNEETNEVESRDQVFKPKLVTDLAITWNLHQNTRFTIGGNNIFDVYPDRHTHSGNISNGRFVYSRRVQQFGVRGAHYFARLSVSI